MITLYKRSLLLQVPMLGQSWGLVPTLIFLDVDIKRSRTRSRIRGTLNRIRGTDTNSPITAFSRHFSVIRGIEERMEQRSKTNNNNRQPSKQ
jgi:hypothetical protein